MHLPFLPYLTKHWPVLRCLGTETAALEIARGREVAHLIERIYGGRSSTRTLD